MVAGEGFHGQVPHWTKTKKQEWLDRQRYTDRKG